jgi:hypothetical protein
MKTEESTSALKRESRRRRRTDPVHSLAELSPGLTLSPIGTRPTPSFPGSLRVLAHGQVPWGGRDGIQDASKVPGNRWAFPGI